MATYFWSNTAVNDLWSNAANWLEAGGPPGSGDAAILGNIGGSVGEAVVISGADVAIDTLIVGLATTNSPTLTVDSGRTFTIDSTGSSIDDGSIIVQTGATMVWNFSATFSNQGTIVIGEILNSNGGNGTLAIDGAVTLNDGGTVDLGQVSNAFHNESSGSIKNSGATSDTLINVDNTIAGGGTISISHFDNQAGGTVEATQQEGFALQISSATFSNEGAMVAQSRAVLGLGTDGQSGSLTNTGGILVASNGDLAISGNYTISGSGAVLGLNGSGGADITSDGTAASTFTNESNIEYGGEFGGSGQIGDEGQFGVTNDLTFDNSGGTVLVTGAGNTLTLNTGSNTITDTEGGSFLAENGGQMDIDSAVTTGGSENLFMGHVVGGGGTIEALNGGTVTISSAITPGGSGILFGDGQILIEGGTVVMATGATDTTPINFSGGGTLQFDGALVDDSFGTIIGGMGLDDVIDLRYLSFQTFDHAVFNSGTLSLLFGNGLTPFRGDMLASFTLSGAYTSANFTVMSDGNGGTEIEYINSPPPAGTTATMIMNNPSNGDYEIYDVGGNAVLQAYSLDQIASPLAFVGLGDLNGTDTSDMLLRNTSTGAFEAYYVSGNSITGSALVGTVGLNWNFSGTGNFDGASSLSEMLLRNSSSGGFELYQVQGGGVLAGSAVGAVGNNLQVSGFGYFSESTTEQMAMEQANVSPGSNAYWLYTYNPATNSYGSAGASGTIGSNLGVVGVADILGNGSSELIMEQANVTPGTNAYWAYMYNPSNNTFDAIGNKALGTVGSNFHVVGFGQLGTAGQDEMLMQDTAGDFEVYQYNANENAFDGTAMGAVGAPWVVDGIAANTGASGASSASTAQLVQAMASMGGSSAVSTANGPTVGAEQSQPTLLTTPHPA